MKILNIFLLALISFLVALIVGDRYDKAFAPLPKFENVTVPVASFVESKMGFNTSEPVSNFELKSERKAVQIKVTKEMRENIRYNYGPYTNWWIKFEKNYRANQGFYIEGRHLSQKERMDCVRRVRNGYGINETALDFLIAKYDGCYVYTDDGNWACPSNKKEYQQVYERMNERVRKYPDWEWPREVITIHNPCEK